LVTATKGRAMVQWCWYIRNVLVTATKGFNGAFSGIFETSWFLRKEELWFNGAFLADEASLQAETNIVFEMSWLLRKEELWFNGAGLFDAACSELETGTVDETSWLLLHKEELWFDAALVEANVPFKAAGRFVSTLRDENSGSVIKTSE
jgi:hypothetical protein